MGRISDPDPAAVVDRHEVRSRRGVQERVQERPVRDRIRPVPHALRLAIGRRDRPGVEMIARDHDGTAELARCHHPIDNLPEAGPLAISQPADAGRESLPGHVFLREADPPSERLILREFAEDNTVRLPDVIRVPRDRDPSEGSAAFEEQGPNEQWHEALE